MAAGCAGDNRRSRRRSTTGRSSWAALALAALLSAGPAAGCMRAARPAPPRTQQGGVAGDAPAPPPPRDSGVYHGATFPSPRAGSAFDDPSTGIATVASAVAGAGQAEAVAVANTALVVLHADRYGAAVRPDGALGDLPPGWDQVDGTAEDVYRRVAGQIQTSFPHIVEVRFATDPATAAQLVSLAARVRAQEPAAGMLASLADLAGRMPVRYVARRTPGQAATPGPPGPMPAAGVPPGGP